MFSSVLYGRTGEVYGIIKDMQQLIAWASGANSLHVHPGQFLPPHLQTYIKALPTREDMDKYIHRLESSYKSEIQTLKTSLTDTQNKIMDMDTKIVNLDQKMILLEEKKIEHDRYLSYIINITDNLENRSRRNNIRVRGLPETVNVENLRKTLQNIFNSLLERPGETEIEIDRVHRIQGPKVNDSGKPRDVICRIHFFQVKEKIMIAAPGF